jgi:16S rRNA C967 or C1407 C5-methylase (RsmB/RsmF family)
MLKKLITYLDLRVFLTFHTCTLTPLEPNLTVVAWRAKKFGAVALKSTKFFSGTEEIANFYNGIHGKDGSLVRFVSSVKLGFFLV